MTNIERYINLKMDEFMRMDNKELAKNLLILLNDNESFDDCDDNQCDNETCVLIKSLKKYLKNN